MEMLIHMAQVYSTTSFNLKTVTSWNFYFPWGRYDLDRIQVPLNILLDGYGELVNQSPPDIKENWHGYLIAANRNQHNCVHLWVSA